MALEGGGRGHFYGSPESTTVACVKKQNHHQTDVELTLLCGGARIYVYMIQIG